MGLEKQIVSTAKCLEHGSFLSQEFLILQNQYYIMLELENLKKELERIPKSPTIEEMKTFGPE